jgi:hypothetical protein
MIYASWRAYAKSYLNYPSYKLSENTFYKEMSHCLILIIETTFFIFTPISLN